MRVGPILGIFVLGAAIGAGLFWAARPQPPVTPPAPVRTVADTLSTGQRAEVKQAVADYLRENPDAVVDAIRAYQARREAAQDADQKEQIKASEARLARDADDPILGNPDGDVTVVEFFDYRCPYCKRVSPELAALAKQDPKVRIVLKEMPILGRESGIASRVALAAKRQGKYAPMHDALMATQGSLDDARIAALAGQVGIDAARLRKDMDDPAIEAHIKRVLDLAHELSITGTPAFVVGDKVIPGAVSVDTLKGLVDAARKTTG